MNSRATISDAELRDALALHGRAETPPGLYDVLDGIARSRPRPRRRPPALRLLIAAALAAIATGALFLASGSGPSPRPAPSPSATPWRAPAGLVTESFESGVERITGDDAGHIFEAVSDIAFGADGAVWMLRTGGLFQVGVPGYWPAPERPDNVNSDLTMAPDGTLWALSGRTVASFTDGRWTPAPALPGPLGNSVRALEVLPDGKVWGRTLTGLVRLDGGSWTVFPAADADIPLPDHQDRRIFPGNLAFDGDGLLWVGFNADDTSTSAGALARFDGVSWELITLPADTVGRPAAPVGALDGSMWIVYELNLPGHRRQPFLARLVDGSWTIYDEAAGARLVGVPGGVVGHHEVGADGRLWATTDEGIAAFDGQTWTEPSSVPFLDRGALVAAPDGTLWVASDQEGGVYIFRR